MTIRIYFKETRDSYGMFKDYFSVVVLTEISDRYYFKTELMNEAHYWLKRDIVGLPQIVE